MCRLIHDRELTLFGGERLMGEKVYHMLKKKTGYSDQDMQKRFGGREREGHIAAHTHTHKQTYTTHTYACVCTHAHKHMCTHTHFN